MPARILSPTPKNIALAAASILSGNVVGLPTETVYGLAGLALDESALTRIFQTKDRPTFDPLIVHVAAPPRHSRQGEFDWLIYLAEQHLIAQERLSNAAKRQVRLLAHFWPGPLTMVLPKHERVPDLATSGLPTVALRAPRHPVAQALLREVGQPLAAPSANRFGRLSPTCAADVDAELGERIDLILDGGPCEIGLESTVVGLDDSGGVTLLRPGAFSREQLSQHLGISVAMPNNQYILPGTQPQISPGLLASHYAPAKPLYLLPAAVEDLSPSQLDELTSLLAGRRRIGLLAYGRAGAVLTSLLSSAAIRILSERSDQAEAARNLFRCLRELDADSQVDLILAEPVPDPTGLGHAIADRLSRASTPLP